jgi:hypothetical protein
MFQFIVNRILSARLRAARSRSKQTHLVAENPGRENLRKNSVPRPSLYCVWIPAHEGENAPLIRVWIDPSMSMFDSQAHVHEPDLIAAREEADAAVATEGQS